LAIRQLLRRWWLGKLGRPADLLTGVVSPDKDGRWAVVFAGDGLRPDEIHGWTLTDVVDRTSSAVAALYAQHPAVDGAELQLVIYPWEYDHGPIFDITGHPGAFVARDIQGSDVAVDGATLENLVTAIARLGPPVSEDSILRWGRPVALISVPPTSPLSG
jgi:hypothetical protein